MVNGAFATSFPFGGGGWRKCVDLRDIQFPDKFVVSWVRATTFLLWSWCGTILVGLECMAFLELCRAANSMLVVHQEAVHIFISTM